MHFPLVIPAEVIITYPDTTRGSRQFFGKTRGQSNKEAASFKMLYYLFSERLYVHGAKSINIASNLF